MTQDVYRPPPGLPTILYQDHQIVVVDKPSGLLSVPGKGEGLEDCVIERLRGVFPEVLLVHRLDRDTSGVMIFALTPHAQRFLGQEFENRRTKKVYVARVWGQIEAREGTVDAPLQVDWPNRPKQHVHPDGRPAHTDWRAVKVLENETRVRLYPRTGRSHQLRVHMLHIGHVILGDPLYATGAAREFPRLMLHSESLRVRHPETQISMNFSSKSPF